MADHILGPGGSRRRRLWRGRFVVLPVVAISALAFFLATALAVHDQGLFELDRNTQDPAGGGDDWDTIFANGGAAEVHTFVTDNVGAGTQFQAGGSKDNADISDWLWKTGEPLDKDDITNGYAAGYLATTDTGDTNVGDFILYFGLDRLANNGSAQVGFWFFKNEISLTNTPTGGGFLFDGVHAVGDILIQSNFSNGGVISSISVFEWVGSGGSHDELDLRFSATDCVDTNPSLPGNQPLAGDDPACATVNQVTVPGPAWDYEAKFPDPADPTGFPQGSFFEGGLNVTRLIPDAGCLSTFMVETRTSTPFDARLKDFALGDFNTCQIQVETTSDPTTDDVLPGTSVHDDATVTGSSLIGAGAPAPTGDLTFFLCNPTEVTANGGDCSAGGTEISTNPLVPDPGGGSFSTASSDSTNETTALGKYCWRAEYEPDEDSPYPAASFTDSTAECFTVVAVDTATTTRQFVYPQDKARITAPSGGDLAGSVTFELFDSSAECTANVDDTEVYSETIAISGASGQTAKTSNYPPDADAYAITDGTQHFWRVFYDSTNPAQNDSLSNCTEATTVTFAGNDGTITPIP